MSLKESEKPVVLVSVALLTAITVTMALAIVGWATIAYDWNSSIFGLVASLFAVAWIGVFAVLNFCSSRSYISDMSDRLEMELNSVHNLLRERRVDHYVSRAETRLKSVE